jgi:hypothetical protein
LIPAFSQVSFGIWIVSVCPLSVVTRISTLLLSDAFVTISPIRMKGDATTNIDPPTTDTVPIALSSESPFAVAGMVPRQFMAAKITAEVIAEVILFLFMFSPEGYAVELFTAIAV